MTNPGVFFAVCASLLAADGAARPAPLPEPAAAPRPACRFTLERAAAERDDEGETWVLTCHRIEAPATPHTVALRRITPTAAQ